MAAAAAWIEDLQKLKEEFLRCTRNRLETIERLVARLERDPGDRAAGDELLRQFHGLAGSGACFGFPRVSELGRQGEALCAKVLAREAAGGDHCERLRACGRAVAEALAGEPAAAGEADATAAARPREDAPEVLVVDGDDEARRDLCVLLEQEGLAPRDARTRAEALASLEARLPDGLLAAVELPDGSGYELVDRVRDSPGGHLPSILLLGPAGRLDRGEALHCGADGCFEKPAGSPAHWGALLRRLHHLLDCRRARAPRVLYVEDEPEQAAFVRSVLKPAGYQVRCCDHPNRFLAEIAAYEPELVLMDVVLPGGASGFDLVRHLRQDERHATLPVVFLTTQGQLQARIETARAGGDEHLEKPVSPALLLSTVAARIERSRFLRNLLNQDGLTRLLTHSAFLERARTVVAERRRDSGNDAVWVMVDVDHFKSINDRFGHPTGDRVLVALATLFRRHLRQADTIGRYGGEEFAILLGGLAAGEAVQVVDRLRRDFAAIEHTAAGGQRFAATWSAGVAELGYGMDLDEWREAADRALYAAKRGGRNRVELAAAAEPPRLRVVRAADDVAAASS